MDSLIQSKSSYLDKLSYLTMHVLLTPPFQSDLSLLPLLPPRFYSKMLLFATFLFNLLCGLVPCDPNYSDPIVSSVPYKESDLLREGRTCNESETSDPVVTLPSGGRLEGYGMKTVKGRPILAFEGIRYGRAERWKVRDM